VLGLVLSLGCADGIPVGDAPSAQPEAAAPQSAIEDTGETLKLALISETADEVVAELYYTPRDDMKRPRVMELMVKASAELMYVSAERLEAAEAAGKQLVVQRKDEGVLRTILFATNNLNLMGPGALIRYRFKRIGTASARLELLPTLPIFAPADANDGLMLQEPLMVEGR